VLALTKKYAQNIENFMKLENFDISKIKDFLNSIPQSANVIDLKRKIEKIYDNFMVPSLEVIYFEDRGDYLLVINDQVEKEYGIDTICCISNVLGELFPIIF
jgi:hypothetical protein